MNNVPAWWVFLARKHGDEANGDNDGGGWRRNARRRPPPRPSAAAGIKVRVVPAPWGMRADVARLAAAVRSGTLDAVPWIDSNRPPSRTTIYIDGGGVVATDWPLHAPFELVRALFARLTGEPIEADAASSTTAETTTTRSRRLHWTKQAHEPRPTIECVCEMFCASDNGPVRVWL